MTDLAAFLAVSALVIVTPGQDTLLTIRNTLLGGRTEGAFTALGVASGQACWTLAASVGVVALLAASEPVFMALRLAGAVYLIYLGLHSLLGALRRVDTPNAAGVPERRPRPATAFRQGLVSNLGNPKMGVFFTSLLPQFAARGDSSFAPLLALGLVFCVLTLVWLTCYAAVIARAGDALRRHGVRRALDALMGGVVVVFGARLAAERP